MSVDLAEARRVGLECEHRGHLDVYDCSACRAAARSIVALAAEVERLRAIEAKLPKTADGVVVVLGDNLYGVDHDGTVFGCGFISMTAPSENYGEWFGIGRGEDGSEWRSMPRMFYSTRKAAEAAMKGSPQ